MNEFERSEYCRECGLYPEQLDAWKAAFEALDTDAVPANKHEPKKSSYPLARGLKTLSGAGLR
jgi:hypothetical protein